MVENLVEWIEVGGKVLTCLAEMLLFLLKIIF